MERMFSYDRDIVCLPRSFANKNGLVQIPRKPSTREFLAANKLFGKIKLTSSMTEQEIMDEIRSVFSGPMNDDAYFQFDILQCSGGGSKSLNTPVVSASYKWSASAVAGKNSKVPIWPRMN